MRDYVAGTASPTWATFIYSFILQENWSKHTVLLLFYQRTQMSDVPDVLVNISVHMIPL